MGDEIFRTRPDRPWYPYPAPCTAGTGCFTGVKRPGRGADHPPPSKYRGHERVGLYLYSPSGPQWPVIGRTFTFSFICIQAKGVGIRAYRHSAVATPPSPPPPTPSSTSNCGKRTDFTFKAIRDWHYCRHSVHCPAASPLANQSYISEKYISVLAPK